MRIDRQGRVVLPKELREQAGLTPDQDLCISVEDGALVIRREADRQAMLLGQLRALARPGGSSDALLRERREEAQRETIESWLTGSSWMPQPSSR